MLDHATTEHMLREFGLAWTALRHGFYDVSDIRLMGDALETGVIEAPEDGMVAWTAHADLAEAAAIILTNDGPTSPVTGLEALDLSNLAGIASELLNRPVRRELSPMRSCGRKWRHGERRIRPSAWRWAGKSRAGKASSQM